MRSLAFRLYLPGWQMLYVTVDLVSIRLLQQFFVFVIKEWVKIRQYWNFSLMCPLLLEILIWCFRLKTWSQTETYTSHSLIDARSLRWYFFLWCRCFLRSLPSASSREHSQQSLISLDPEPLPVCGRNNYFTFGFGFLLDIRLVITNRVFHQRRVQPPMSHHSVPDLKKNV